MKVEWQKNAPVSPEPPGPRAQAPRRLWGQECLKNYKVCAQYKVLIFYFVAYMNLAPVLHCL